MVVMNEKKILEKAVKKAIDAGWRPMWGVVDPNKIESNRYTVMLSKGDQNHEYAHEEIIFNHDFAKALWGEELGYVFYEGLPTLKLVKKPEDTGEYLKNSEWWLPAWQHHLQLMVISDDPIEYIGDNI